jgi:hypothetical protein
VPEAVRDRYVSRRSEQGVRASTMSQISDTTQKHLILHCSHATTPDAASQSSGVSASWWITFDLVTQQSVIVGGSSKRENDGLVNMLVDGRCDSRVSNVGGLLVRCWRLNSFCVVTHPVAEQSTAAQERSAI